MSAAGKGPRRRRTRAALVKDHVDGKRPRLVQTKVSELIDGYLQDEAAQRGTSVASILRGLLHAHYTVARGFPATDLERDEDTIP